MSMIMFLIGQRFRCWLCLGRTARGRGCDSGWRTVDTPDNHHGAGQQHLWLGRFSSSARTLACVRTKTSHDLFHGPQLICTPGSCITSFILVFDIVDTNSIGSAFIGSAFSNLAASNPMMCCSGWIIWLWLATHQTICRA